MKSIKLLIWILIGFTISSCSSDDNLPTENTTAKISKWISKEHTFYDNNVGYVDDPIVTDSVEYIIENNKIISFSGLTEMTDIPTIISGDVSYSNNKITQLQRFENNQLITKIDFLYNSADELTEFKTRYWDSYNQEFEYHKSEFVHTSDTIYGNHYSSIDGIQYEFSSNSKAVLDSNDNRTYYEDTYNGQTGVILTTYDANDNMLMTNIYGNNIFNYTYSSIINTEAIITNATFGKKNHMLIYGEGNGFSPTTVSTNTIENISHNSSPNNFEYIIDIQSNQDNYAMRTSYKEILNDIPRSQDVSEYIFE